MIYWYRCHHTGGKTIWGKLGKAARPSRASCHSLGAKVNSKVHPLPSTSAIKINPINFHPNWILVQHCHGSQLLLERGHVKSLRLIPAPSSAWHQHPLVVRDSTGWWDPRNWYKEAGEYFSDSSCLYTGAESLFLSDFTCNKSTA